MKRMLIGIVCILSCIVSVQAESYCVMNGNDGSIIEEKDMHKTQSVASISKIMTAIIAIEEGNMEDIWEVSDAITQANGSSIYLQVGQQVSLKSLLYGLMLRSGNDAAVEIAQHIGGSQEAFVEKMNQKAKVIGMMDTNFENPSGLDEAGSGNISSAYDMALLMKYAMKNPLFQEIDSAPYYTSEWNYRWKNKNRLIFDFADTTGGKTGFTKKAGRTLVSSAKADGVESVVVTLGMSSEDFSFHEEKHKEVFSKLDACTILEAGTYQFHGYEAIIEEALVVTYPYDRQEIQVTSTIEKKELVVTITLPDGVKTYRYPIEKVATSLPWWRRLFS